MKIRLPGRSLQIVFVALFEEVDRHRKMIAFEFRRQGWRRRQAGLRRRLPATGTQTGQEQRRQQPEARECPAGPARQSAR